MRPVLMVGGCLVSPEVAKMKTPPKRRTCSGSWPLLPPFKGTIKRVSSREVIFFFPLLLSKDGCLPWLQGKTFPLLPSPTWEIYSRKDVDYPLQHLFPLHYLIPLFLILLRIWFGSLGAAQMGTNKDACSPLGCTFTPDPRMIPLGLALLPHKGRGRWARAHLYGC